MRAAGPLGRYISFIPKEPGPGYVQFPQGVANAQIILHRVAWGEGDTRAADRALLEQAPSRMFPRPLLGAAKRRREAAVARLERRGAYVKRFDVKPVDRMVIGLGDENPQEIGFRLHGTYGVPILPGQSLKGLARAAVPPSANESDKEVVLGGEARGATVFLDALPLPGGDHRVTLDVLTPHGHDEWDEPKPVPFLTATSNLAFRVHVVALERGGQMPNEVLYAEEWLKQGLEDVGLGAKTSSGYGYMRVTEVAG